MCSVAKEEEEGIGWGIGGGKGKGIGSDTSDSALLQPLRGSPIKCVCVCEGSLFSGKRDERDTRNTFWRSK